MLIKVLLFFCYCVSSQSILLSLAPLSLGEDIKRANINNRKRRRSSDVENDRTESDKEWHAKKSETVCDVCGKECCRASALAKHKRIHTREKPYTCDVCQRAFSDSSNYNRHKKIHSQKKYLSGDKPHKCADCHQSYTMPYNLMVHQRLHTGENLYECAVCKKKFSQNSSRDDHEKRHRQENYLIGEKLYECDGCEKRFEYSVFLKWHQEKHFKAAGFQCFVCKEFFIKGSLLYFHREKHEQKKDILFSCARGGCGGKHFSTQLAHYRHTCIVHSNKNTKIQDLENDFYEFFNSLIEDKSAFLDKASLEMFFKDYDQRKEKLFSMKLKKEERDMKFLFLGDILSLLLEVRWSVRNKIENQNRGVEKIFPDRHYLLIYDKDFLEDIKNKKLKDSEFALFLRIFLDMFYEEEVPLKVMRILNKHMPNRSA